MNRPTGVTVAAVLTFSGAMILALASFGFLVIGVMVVTGDEGRAPVSEAIAGMALTGGFSLLVLAVVAGYTAFNIAELREWARTISLSDISASARERLRRAFSAMDAARRAWLTESASSHKTRRLEHHPWRRI
jgi:hypothetical protein